MKRLLPLLLLFVFCASQAQAQRLRETDDMLDKQVLSLNLTGPQMALVEMKLELKLTAEQMAQLEAVNEKRYQHMMEVESTFTDPLELQREFRNIHIELDKVLANILTEGQLKHYLELEGRQHVHHLSSKEAEE